MLVPTPHLHSYTRVASTPTPSTPITSTRELNFRKIATLLSQVIKLQQLENIDQLEFSLSYLLCSACCLVNDKRKQLQSVIKLFDPAESAYILNAIWIVDERLRAMGVTLKPPREDGIARVSVPRTLITHTENTFRSSLPNIIMALEHLDRVVQYINDRLSTSSEPQINPATNPIHKFVMLLDNNSPATTSTSTPVLTPASSCITLQTQYSTATTTTLSSHRSSTDDPDARRSIDLDLGGGASFHITRDGSLRGPVSSVEDAQPPPPYEALAPQEPRDVAAPVSAG